MIFITEPRCEGEHRIENGRPRCYEGNLEQERRNRELEQRDRARIENEAKEEERQEMSKKVMDFQGWSKTYGEGKAQDDSMNMAQNFEGLRRFYERDDFALDYE